MKQSVSKESSRGDTVRNSYSVATLHILHCTALHSAHLELAHSNPLHSFLPKTAKRFVESEGRGVDCGDELGYF